mmetsp:Transcript_9332/g.23115  ORF Transcript_9332/g.23115 Transcript_9332/m.23115 type:complete len:262 (-) Transcript_9332:773-1558(-)
MRLASTVFPSYLPYCGRSCTTIAIVSTIHTRATRMASSSGGSGGGGSGGGGCHAVTAAVAVARSQLRVELTLARHTAQRQPPAGCDSPQLAGHTPECGCARTPGHGAAGAGTREPHARFYRHVLAAAAGRRACIVSAASSRRSIGSSRRAGSVPGWAAGCRGGRACCWPGAHWEAAPSTAAAGGGQRVTACTAHGAAVQRVRQAVGVGAAAPEVHAVQMAWFLGHCGSQAQAAGQAPPPVRQRQRQRQRGSQQQRQHWQQR